MKQAFIVIFFLLQLPALANMAEPVQRGTFGSRPFTNEFVDVLHENLFIRLDEQFKFADFEIEYEIESSKNGIDIPLLFYASEYYDDFTVFMDGKKVEIKDIPFDLQTPDNTKFKDFSYFFEYNERNSRKETVWIGYSANRAIGAKISNFLYFETDIPKGKHKIRVTYTATNWRDGWDWINEYSFRYALSPAKYWRSFGTLSLTIDATNFNHPINVNVGNPSHGNIDSVAVWTFENLPEEVLKVSYKPKVSAVAGALMFIGPGGLAGITGLVLVICHIAAVIVYRKRKPEIRYSAVVIIGSILLPLIFVFSWMYFYSFIDDVIGENASRRHGYSFLVIFIYPVIMPAYWFVVYLLDRYVKAQVIRLNA